MPVLYGIHDREGRHIVPSDGWVVDTVALSDNPAPTNYTALRADINWIVRINWGYGSTGTIPLPIRYDDFVQRCINYVTRSRGARIWIIGNEPNHENERPNGVYITPVMYAECFLKCRTAIKLADPNAQVLPAPCAPYHANPVSWLDYWREMLEIIAANGGCDGLALHAYTRSSDPDDINDDVRMGPPLENTCAGFLTYQDALAAVPAPLRHLPAYITEFNELLPGGWEDRNTGVVQEVYRHVNWWNQQAAEDDDPQIHCLVLYRWPRFDRWHIEGKQGVIDDFRMAVERGYQSPHSPVVSQPAQTSATQFLPSLSTGGENPPLKPALPPREIDPRAERRGTRILDGRNLQPGRQYWYVKRLYTPNENESDRLGPDRHVLANVLIDGQRQVGVPLRVYWGNNAPDERATIHTKHNPDFAFSADHALTPGSFAIYVDDGKPSEIVIGVTMGDFDADGSWNPGAHTSTLVEFELATVPEAQPTEPTPDPETVPRLYHPLGDRRVPLTQRFGENPAAYARFGWAGHTGLDFGAAMATPVYAVDAGQVQEAGQLADYGHYIKLRHPWGESLYAHLSQVQVEQGAHVQPGEQIALSGNTGNSTGPHLHFGMRVNPYTRGYPFDGYTDPLPYLLNVAAPQPAQSTSQKEIVKLLCEAALEFDVDPDLLLSQAWAESSFNPRAASQAGAKGLMQVMPNTWAEQAAKIGAGDDPFDARQNARVGARYMKYLLQALGNKPYDALVAYGWGIGNVLGDEPYPDVWVNYANKVIHGRDLLKAVGAG